MKSRLGALSGILLAAAMSSSPVVAETLFFDDFEDRVRDQERIGMNWTWYNQTFSGDTCASSYVSGWGPYDDGDASDYEQENRNYWTASADFGQGDSYFRAGLEVPAWGNDQDEQVVLGNMLRIYGDQYYNENVTSCKRTLVFQEMDVPAPGSYTFSFDMAMDRYGAPANGEVTAAFVKVLKTSDLSYADLLGGSAEVETNPPEISDPESATTESVEINFEITEDMVGELLQFGFSVDITESLGQSWQTSAVLYDNIRVGTTELGPAHSGSYYNNIQNGHGFSIEIGLLFGQPLAVVYWYTYDNLGNPIFMVGSGVPDGSTITVEFDSPVGMQYGNFDLTSPTPNVGGTGVFKFSDRQNATFSYTPSSFSNTQWGHTTPMNNLPLKKIFEIPADKNFPDTE